MKQISQICFADAYDIDIVPMRMLHMCKCLLVCRFKWNKVRSRSYIFCGYNAGWIHIPWPSVVINHLWMNLLKKCYELYNISQRLNVHFTLVPLQKKWIVCWFMLIAVQRDYSPYHMCTTCWSDEWKCYSFISTHFPPLYNYFCTKKKS